LPRKGFGTMTARSVHERMYTKRRVPDRGTVGGRSRSDGANSTQIGRGKEEVRKTIEKEEQCNRKEAEKLRNVKRRKKGGQRMK